MSEISDCIIKILADNGVSVEQTDIWKDNGLVRNVKSIIELNFSEHDKVFEDKIAELENQIDTLNEEKLFLRTRCMPYVEKDFDNRLYGKLAIVSCNEEFVDIQKYADGDDLYSREVRNLISEGGIKRLIGQYRNISARLDKISDENKELKQRIAELESKNEQLKYDIDKMAESNSKWIDRAVEWQQKCEKLESKEVEKPTKCTIVIVAKEINGQTYVTLDDFMSVVNDLQAEIGT